jgi:rhodanese-related sulfurtransferase
VAHARIAATTMPDAPDAPARKTLAELLVEARGRLERLEPRAAFEAQSAGALLIDTRSNDERLRDGVIPGALHIPRSVLEWRLDPDADPDFHNPHVDGLEQQLVLVCAHGESTSLAAATLRELGFARATDVVGGFEAWRESGLPVAPAPRVDPNAQPGMGRPD